MKPFIKIESLLIVKPGLLTPAERKELRQSGTLVIESEDGALSVEVMSPAAIPKMPTSQIVADMLVAVRSHSCTSQKDAILDVLIKHLSLSHGEPQ